MKHNKCKCPKSKRNRSVTRRNRAGKNTRRERLDGREYLVVPVVMARTDVVMNGGLIPADEIHAPSWNGVPVTMGHPNDADDSMGSANSPKAYTRRAVGRIFNAEFDGVKLRAEAWIDIHKANAMWPGIIMNLEQGEPMDVSTGYFSDDFPAKGVVNGREYNTLQRALKPDHLALLPGEIGACSWEDGCGVRANRSKANMPKAKGKEKSAVANALSVLAAALGVSFGSKTKANERGEDDDRRTIIADLISNDDSPFTPDDEDALRMMSDKTLEHQRNAYLASNEDDEVDDNEDDDKSENEEDETSENEDDETASNEDDKSENEDDEEKPEANKNKAKGKGTTTVTNSRRKPVKKAKANCSGGLSLNSEDREALAFARKLVSNKRQEFIEKIVANSKLTEEDLKDLTTTKLEKIANGLRTNIADFSGRAVPPMDPKSVSESTKAMLPESLTSIILNNAKAKKEKA